MKRGFPVALLLAVSCVQGFLWNAKVDMKSAIHILMNAAEEQSPHARKKLVTQVITGILTISADKITYSGLSQRLKNLKEVDTEKQKGSN